MIDNILQILTFVTAIAIMFLQINQSRWMWVMEIVSCSAAMVLFFRQHLYATFLMNAYFIVVSVIGLVRWSSEKKESGVVLRKMSWKVAGGSLAGFLLGCILFSRLAAWMGDPKSTADVAATILGALAIWWTSRMYLTSWILWMVSDLILVGMCAATGMRLLSIMYAMYIVSSLIGFFNWKKNVTRYIE